LTEKKKDNDVPVEAHLSPYPVSRLAPSIELVDLAKEIAKADDFLSLQVTGKLEMLGRQIQALQVEARQILEETRRSQDLHRAECGFKKIPGRVYYLYRKENDTLWFSMLSPQDWGEKNPFPFIGSYRLENDMSWTEVDES
jgi:hypothetical protein